MNNKIYQTKQKNLINNLLSSHSESHYTVEQIINILEEQDTPVSKSTLYRILEQMLENNEVLKYNIDGVSYYQYIFCDKRNSCVHFKCKTCGKVLHIDNKAVNTFDNRLSKEYGIELDSKKTVLYGLCKNCKESNQ